MKSVEIRPSVDDDVASLRVWMREPGILRWFPMVREVEVMDSIRYWQSFFSIGSSLTALVEGKPAGMALIYVQPFLKTRHQALFVIVVGGKWRGKGVGTKLVKELMRLGKEKFHLKSMHLEVYEDNPAIRLYERLGFKKFGQQERFLKEPDGSYRIKIMMQKDL
ncbi:MAG: GNAT family N-acetyltransferase [Candidatus Algichlamydia australiensis]|nr:GNAT family N-acetyltransferase [Chlamydiales bacterium]